MANSIDRRIVFYGHHNLTVDSKNRLMIPADIRGMMNPKVHGKAFFATFRKQVPWLYPEQAYKEMFIEQVPADITPDDEDLEYVHLKLSSAIRLPIDTQGRVVLPERLLDRAELDKEVTLIGAGDHLELWSAKRWQDRQDDLFGRNSDIEKRQKENREKRTQ